MTKRRSSLTGSWSGAYRYPRNGGPETVFSAAIEEGVSEFVGSTQEPNYFAPSEPAVLTARIDGAREGQSVTFTKFYDHEKIGHGILYLGTVDEALLRIEGTWTANPNWSGTFFMVRDDDGEAAEVEEAVEIEVRR